VRALGSDGPKSKPRIEPRSRSRRAVQISTETELSLEEVREAVEMAWTDATRLPATRESREVCTHLQNAAECLDRMIEQKERGR